MWTGTAKRRSFPRWGGALLLLLLPIGCTARHPADWRATDSKSQDQLAPGVAHHSLPTGDASGVDLIDIDLARAPVRIVIAAEDIKRLDGLVTGRAYTPHEWLDHTHAFAATNGGYFGLEVAGDRKEIVGLLVQNGKVRRAASPLQGRGSINVQAGRYVRSAFGLSATGKPEIVWAATDATPVMLLRRYAAPVGARIAGTAWTVRQAVGCGPMLFHNGNAVVTDRPERLVSPGPEARTFVAYDGSPGAPRHFVLGMASDMAYQDVAEFLQDYFKRYDSSRPTDAMCLDGGASTQLSYRLPNGTVQSPRETGVTVPDAIVILPR